jgi:hypothetical protein
MYFDIVHGNSLRIAQSHSVTFLSFCILLFHYTDHATRG